MAVMNAKIPDGRIENKWDNHRFNLKLVNPSNRRKYHLVVVGTGLAGASAAASLAELGYRVTSLCYHESAAARPQHRRAGGHQRPQELRQRRGQHLPAVLRHGQGGRLPGARGQRLPAGAGQRQHHRPVRRPGRAVCARLRGSARQPLVRRRAGVPHLLRARADRAAAAAGRLPGALPADRRRKRDLLRQDGDARSRRRRRSGPRHRGARSPERQGLTRSPPTR